MSSPGVLRPIADGVLVHESESIQSNTVVVEGDDGVLLVDPGITRSELAAIGSALGADERMVVAGFATHPDWDHVLWHPSLGNAPRYATADAAAAMRVQLEPADWQEQLQPWLPPEHADQIPMELLGELTALPVGATTIPWAGPTVRIAEHRAHAPGHAALLIEDARVLVAGDMLSDVLVPFLDLGAEDPLGDYLAALDLLDAVASQADHVVPGHGSVGDADDLRHRIRLDRAYVEALAGGREVDDARIGPDAPLAWMADVHAGQVQRLAER